MITSMPCEIDAGYDERSQEYGDKGSERVFVESRHKLLDGAKRR
jgi:hypothetical protein